MNSKEVSTFKEYSDDWWIEDAQKRVDKLKYRLNHYNMPQKSFRAHIRMILHAVDVLNNAKWLKKYHLKEGNKNGKQ